jgi:hypothetical protein
MRCAHRQLPAVHAALRGAGAMRPTGAFKATYTMLWYLGMPAHSRLQVCVCERGAGCRQFVLQTLKGPHT